MCSDYVLLSSMLLAKTHSWNSCKLTLTLVLLLVTLKDVNAMHAVLRWQSRTLDNLSTMFIIKTTLSADLNAQVVMTKQAAFNDKVSTCMILDVSLVNVKMIEHDKNLNKITSYSFFAYVFVLDINREEWYLYQSWIKHDYTLQNWLKRDSNQMRKWKKMKSWLKNFAVLTTVEISTLSFAKSFSWNLS